MGNLDLTTCRLWPGGALHAHRAYGLAGLTLLRSFCISDVVGAGDFHAFAPEGSGSAPQRWPTAPWSSSGSMFSS